MVSNRIAAAVLLVAVVATGCASTTYATTAEISITQSSDSAAGLDSSAGLPPGINLVSAAEGAAIQADPPEDLVILDVRTPEEFEEARLEGAVMLDFYRDDFADRLAELDPTVPYLLYCRSGNRSGQTAALMADLGFTNVSDVDGGIVSWAEAGLATVTG